jgi:hypothetical protein
MSGYYMNNHDDSITVTRMDLANRLFFPPYQGAIEERALTDFSVSDLTHTLHYLRKLLDLMKQLDQEGAASHADDAS